MVLNRSPTLAARKKHGLGFSILCLAHDETQLLSVAGPIAHVYISSSSVFSTLEQPEDPIETPDLDTQMAQTAKAISSPIPESLYPTLAFVMLSLGLIFTAAFFIYEATTSRKNRSLAKELTTGSVASVFLGFGSLFLLLASGVYV